MNTLRLDALTIVMTIFSIGTLVTGALQAAL